MVRNMIKSPGTDRDLLTQKAYATDEMLLLRQRIHELYSIPKINFTEWVLDRVGWRGDEIVLDIGSGPGTYFDQLVPRIPQGHLLAGDLSLGMMRQANKRVQAGLTLNIDAQALPFPDRVFDVILANHMLYHVPDLDQALGEIHRVLKSDGVLIAATNSQFNLPEFEQLIRRAYHLLGAIGPDAQPRLNQHFYLEDGAARLARHFYAVARYDLPGAFVFPTAQPAIDYLNSMRPLREPQLPRRVSWDDFISVMSDQIQRLINHFGELIVNKLTGVLIATDTGAFAREYVSLLQQDA
jgi:SAM-dependent methyltransferase